MSALAVLLKSQGKEILGSDVIRSDETRRLESLGIKVYIKHKSSHIHNKLDLVVFSGAIRQDNTELIRAKNLGIKTMERSQLLRIISDEYENVIAVSGTHGKTTTTAMIAHIFCTAKLNPTVHIGGMALQIGGNILVGGQKYFITEACEFRDSFLTLSPAVSVITNFEEEHLDYFGNFENISKSFCQFCDNTKFVCFAYESCEKYIGAKPNVVYVGSKSSYHLQNLRLNNAKKYSFDAYNGDELIGKFDLNVHGEYNAKNALMAICVARQFGIDVEIIKFALSSFFPVHRRFEKVGEYNGNIVVSDYAHHPTEIAESIKTCREVFERKIICIFQPHTYSRTKKLIDKFTKCFNNVDKLYLVSTYQAREKYDSEGSAKFLKDKILKSSPEFKVYGDFSLKQTLKEIKKIKSTGNVLLFLGAGNVEELSRILCKKRRQ